MKKLVGLGLLVGFMSMQCLHAAEIELAKGTTYVTDKKKVLELGNTLSADKVYDFICVVKGTAATAHRFAAKVSFSFNNGLITWEKDLSDQEYHAVFFPRVQLAEKSMSNFAIQVLSGNDSQDGIFYRCYAEERE